jgi:hypothetical protein
MDVREASRKTPHPDFEGSRTFPGPATRPGGPNDPLTRAGKARVRRIAWMTAKILVWVLGLGLGLGAVIYFLVWIAFA